MLRLPVSELKATLPPQESKPRFMMQIFFEFKNAIPVSDEVQLIQLIGLDVWSLLSVSNEVYPASPVIVRFLRFFMHMVEFKE